MRILPSSQTLKTGERCEFLQQKRKVLGTHPPRASVPAPVSLPRSPFLEILQLHTTRIKVSRCDRHSPHLPDPTRDSTDLPLEPSLRAALLRRSPLRTPEYAAMRVFMLKLVQVTAPPEAASPHDPGPCPGRRGQGFAQSKAAR